jgi:hypothetical protein
MGHKGPVLRRRCFGTARARTQILFYSNVRVKYQSGASAYCLYLFGYPNRLMVSLAGRDRRYGKLKSPATIIFTSFFKYPIFLRDFQHIRIVSTDFHKVLCTKFHRNPSDGSLADTCWEEDSYEEANLCFLHLLKWAYKQDRQCTCNAIFRRVRVTIAAVKKQQVLNMSVCM